MPSDQTAIWNGDDQQVVVTRQPDGAALLYVHDGKGSAEILLTADQKAALVKGLEMT